MEYGHQGLRVDRAACRKAEKDTILAEEEKELRAPKTTHGLDHHSPSSEPVALNNTGIDNTLDALSLTSAHQSEKIDRHPVRRYKAGFEDRLLPEVEEEHKGEGEGVRETSVYNQANAR